MYSSRVYRMVEEWTTCMRLLSWRRHQGTMLKNCILIPPVSEPAKQAAQVVKHHVFDERTVITRCRYGYTPCACYVIIQL
jgi:hypothetical protein